LFTPAGSGRRGGRTLLWGGRDRSRRRRADREAQIIASASVRRWGATSALALGLLALAALALAPAGRGAGSVKVFFLQGEQTISVPRPGSTARDAITALLQGPTAAEVKRGVRTYVPKGVRLRSVSVAGGIATVDLSSRFVQGDDADSLLARLTQVVDTLAGPEGATKVQLLIDGGIPLGIFPGAVSSTPIAPKYLETPNVPAPPTPTPTPGPASDSTRSAQERLVALGYLLPGDVDGRLGPATQNAVLAFQKWEGLTRDGALGPQTLSRLATATQPTPITTGPPGKRAEVLIDRQVALMIQDNQVVRTIPVSTGKPSTPTPTGSYRVQAKIPRWWSTPFREWLLWAVVFNGGIAFHQLDDVPPFPASHGCVRESYLVAKWTYDFAVVGMPVNVLATSGGGAT